ncbi:alanine--tRNA ligase [Candidatus Giovannonibacteria bacterium]|nr:alanine--tRNA ligase [Candidatus Giovannonibacteria bacterium]
MSAEELRKKFLEFFKSKGHAVVPSSSLLPDDPSVLLTTAGMQQFKKYYTGEADAMRDFGSKNTASVQKSFRTSDIDEVGDDSHLTFFEMLGNFSFSGYFKKESIQYADEFITKELGVPISFVTIFGGTAEVPKDEESREIWKSLGISDIREMGMEDNFWGPTGNEGPCGPTTEIYCENKAGGRAEIWNVVFNEYYKKDGRLQKLKNSGVDTGMGLERLAMIVQNKKNIFETDLFSSLMEILPAEMDIKTKRIAADHSRAISFLVSDGVAPSNKEAGYVLRRLMRRLISYGTGKESQLFKEIVANYGGFYPELNLEKILPVFNQENEKFSRTLSSGIKELSKFQSIDAKAAFKLYESYGLPFEVIKEYEDGERAKNLTREAFEDEFRKHQEISRAGQEKKFGGHGLLLDTGELKAKDAEELKKVTRLHTATHLLQAALRKVLGDEVSQKGSDITSERTRFDFSFPRKLTPEEIKKVEELVNSVISEGFNVQVEEMDLEEAKKSGALYFFKEKYPSRVKVYSVGSFSKELCGGPHVPNTSEVGKFAIIKEEGIASGVRRIRAEVMP